MKWKGCLIAMAVALGLMTIAVALVAPAFVREGERLYRPIAKMQGAQKDFETWSKEHAFSAPAKVTLSAEQLDRFLRLRKRLDTADEKNPIPIEGLKRNERPDISDIQGLIEGVGGALSGRIEAYREEGMTAEEYRYIERLVYRLWLRPLRRTGLDPAAIARVVKELKDLAARENDLAVGRLLKARASSLSSERAPVPEGFPAEVHALLLGRAIEIDGLNDVGQSAPLNGGGRGFPG